MIENKALLSFTSIVSFFTAYLFNRAVYLYQSLEGNIVLKLNITLDKLFSNIQENLFFVSTDKNSLTAALIGFLLIWLIYLYNVFGSKKYMHGIEHGSASWGKKKDADKFKDLKNPDNNIILSATEALSMETMMKDFEAERNKNVVVVGGSGSGKTLNVKANLMQLHSSFMITDPKGTVFTSTGDMFLQNGFEVRVLNVLDFKKSMHYNPLAYIRSEKDILKVTNVLIENTKGEGEQSKEDFWIKAERLLYQALIGYLFYVVSPAERNFSNLINLIDLSEVKEKNEDFKSPVDVLFENLEKQDPTNFAVRQYKKFKLAAGKTLKSILVSCAARLSPFDIQELRDLTQYDELELDQIGSRKTAFFVIMPDSDKTFNFIIAMMFYQTFNLLCDKADIEYDGRLPFHVRGIFDEFANIGKIPNFHNLISTIRSRGISATIFLQSMNQLGSTYKDDAETIIDCCDTVLFLGGKSTKTTKQIAEMIGKTTIDNSNIQESKGQNGNYSINYQKLGRDLIDPAEIGRLKRSQCLVLITGEQPFKSKKFNTFKHKRYKQLADYDKSKKMDFEKIELEEERRFFQNVQIVEEVDLSELNSLV